MALWLVRAGRFGDRESLALEQGRVLIGWEEMPDLANIAERSELTALLAQVYPDEKPKTRENWESQLWSFIKGIQPNDLVALPLKSRAMIALGRVAGPYEYLGDNPPGAQHTRKVKWLKELPRSAFDQDLLYSFGAFMTVCRIQRNNAEDRVRALLDGKVAAKPKTSTNGEQPADLTAEELEAPPDLEQIAQDQISAFLSRKFRGHDLARLVAAILEAQGYRVRVSPAGADGGVDIIAGQGPLGFESPRLVVQVKSSDSPADVKVLRELQGVMKNFRAEHGLLVSWGGFKSSVEREAAQLFFEIRRWDAADLVEMIQAHYDRLPEALQAELPLKRIWTLVQSEE